MEPNKNKKEVLKEFMRSIEEPINPRLLKEKPYRGMASTKPNFSIFFRPNNYRRQIAVKEKDNSTIQKIKSATSAIPDKHTKIISIKNYKPNITIQYFKNHVVAIYSQNIIGGVKEIFLIERSNLDEIDRRINEIKASIQKRIDEALYDFTTRFEIALPGKPIWIRYEDFIKGEDYIDSIPREVIVHDTFFKKVYGEGIEFISSKKGEKPTVHLKNYIKNRAIENISPRIADELSTTREMVKGVLEMNAATSKTLNDFVTKFLPIQADFAVNIKTHNRVLKGIDRSFRKFNRLLTEKQTKLGDFHV